jgi:hypothetical protein
MYTKRHLDFSDFIDEVHNYYHQTHQLDSHNKLTYPMRQYIYNLITREEDDCETEMEVHIPTLVESFKVFNIDDDLKGWQVLHNFDGRILAIDKRSLIYNTLTKD